MIRFRIDCVACMGVLLFVACQPTGEPCFRIESGWEMKSADNNRWLSATVPGDVATDLLTHGLIPDPYLDTNEWRVQWIEEKEWQYRNVLDWSKNANGIPFENPVLRFEGLDTYASIYLNDSLVLESENAHRAYTVRLPILTKTCTLDVVLHSPVKRGMEILSEQPRLIPVSNEARPIGFQTSSVTRKPMYQYGWDWGPRIASAGIPGTVIIEEEDQPHVGDARIDVELLENGQATLTVDWEHDWPEGTWELSTPPMASSNFSITEAEGQRSYIVHEPELWWPRGMGQQPLYQLRWKPESNRYHSIQWNIGLREIKWVRERDEWGQSFYCQVNGQTVQARGANVIPADFFPVRGEQRQEGMLQDAVDANMNMVRVWGGAVYPNEAFLDFCDANGLLVWQDFMFACCMVRSDESFLEDIKAEARQQITRMRNRTCLAIWCGNNESQRAWESWGWQDMYSLHGEDSIATERAYDTLFHQILPRSVQQLSSAAYWPSSPMPDPEWTPPAGNAIQRSGDEHAWHVWFDTLDFDYFSNHPGRFVSEYGLQSLPDEKTLNDCGVFHFEDASLQFRQRSKMEWLVPGLDGWGMMRIYARRYTADPEITDGRHARLKRWIYLSQLTQMIGLREALDRHRNSHGKYSGSLYWQLNDVWPTVSWSTVDHAGRWKLAHYAVQSANKPRRVIFDHQSDTTIALTAHTDTASPLHDAQLNAWLISPEGDTLSTLSSLLNLGAFSQQTLKFDAMETARTPYILKWRWLDSENALIDAGEYLVGKPSDIEWDASPVQISTMGNAIELTADALTFGVRLSCRYAGRFSDNGFMLFPGEKKTLRFIPENPGTTATIADLEIEHFGQYQ